MQPEEHLAALIAAEAAGQEAKFLFFWDTSQSPMAAPDAGA
jgi:hypothetical protein